MKLFNNKCISKARLDGKIAVVTGSNTGIGKITAREFYRIGARVILACRDVSKGEAAVKEIRDSVVPQSDDQPVGQLIVKKLDLSSFASIKECAKDILDSEGHINLLINNAGIMMCPKSKTEDGFEMQFGVNYLGHFLLTCLLLPRIIHSAPARIVNVASLAHKHGSIHFEDINLEQNYTPYKAYAQSKLANILFSKELANRLKNTGVNVYSLHPGIVKTELGRHFNSACFPGFRYLVRAAVFFVVKTPEEGAQTTLYCSIDENVANDTGYYYRNCAKAVPEAKADNKEDALKLWNKSVEMVHLGDWDPFTSPHDKLPQMLQIN